MKQREYRLNIKLNVYCNNGLVTVEDADKRGRTAVTKDI